MKSKNPGPWLVPRSGRYFPHKKLSAVALAACFAIGAPALGQVEPVTNAQQSVDVALALEMARIFEQAYREDAPGASAIVVGPDGVMFRDARGMASMELGVPLDTGMTFRLGSITKQFTAAAILLLAEDGALALDDSINRFLPDYPTHGEEITIDDLLTHTSGIFNYTNDAEFMQSGSRVDVSTAELVAIFADKPLDFAPGEQWNYSNSGYVLLGAIIEQASGMSYADFVQRRIFDPLGMADSHYGGHQLIDGRVAGYGWDGEAFVNAPYVSMTVPHAAGSLLSTVDDMARWNEALFGLELFSEESLEKMTTEATLNDGSATGYAYGLGVSSFRGAERVHHNGGIHGFVTSGAYFPEQDIYVAVLSNRTGGGANPGTVGSKLAAVALGSPFPEFEAVAVDPEVIETYVGVYRINDTTTRILRYEDGRVYTERSNGGSLEATPFSDTGFYYDGLLTYFEMQPTADGGLEMHMFADGADDPEVAVLTDLPVPARD